MFLNREVELEKINRVISEKKGRAKGILVWGIRRSGKSTLIKEALKGYAGIFVDMEAGKVSFEKNIQLLASAAAEASGLDYLKYVNDFNEILKILDVNGKETVVLLDEYQFLKEGYEKGSFDSFVQIALDNLSDRITIILCGSYISVMRDLAAYSSPLYGRFSLSLELQSFNYYEASAFYPDLSPRDKVAFYSVFGGLPFVLEKLVPEKGLEWNIKEFLLDKSSSVYIVLTETLLKEIFKINKAQEILFAVGNGKKRNNEIASALNVTSSVVADESRRLCDMSILQKEWPVNAHDDKKKTFYTIKDNLVRFFYAVILPESYYLNRYGRDYLWNRIKESVSTFISRRFEDIVREFVALSIRHNGDINFVDAGTYYDSREKNIGYDVVIKQKLGYFIISCKYLSYPLDQKTEREEIEKMKSAENIVTSGLGFASVEGYDNTSPDILRLTGDDIYSRKEIESGKKLRLYLGTIEDSSPSRNF